MNNDQVTVVLLMSIVNHVARWYSISINLKLYVAIANGKVLHEDCNKHGIKDTVHSQLNEL